VGACLIEFWPVYVARLAARSPLRVNRSVITAQGARSIFEQEPKITPIGFPTRCEAVQYGTDLLYIYIYIFIFINILFSSHLARACSRAIMAPKRNNVPRILPLPVILCLARNRSRSPAVKFEQTHMPSSARGTAPSRMPNPIPTCSSITTIQNGKPLLAHRRDTPFIQPSRQKGNMDKAQAATSSADSRRHALETYEHRTRAEASRYLVTCMR